MSTQNPTLPLLPVEHIEQIAQWLGAQRIDSPATGPEFAAAFRHYCPTIAAPAQQASYGSISDRAERGLDAGLWKAQQAQGVPADHFPTKEHIRELAQEAADQVMEQAQVFASAWALVGGRFDNGNALEDAEEAKGELRTLVRSLADLAAETVRPAAAPQAEPRPFAVGDDPAPNDWRLPADLKAGHVTFRKGVHCSALVSRMKALHETAFGVDNLTPEQKAENLAALQACKAPPHDFATQAEPQPEREPLTDELLLAVQSAITCSYADHGRRSVNLQAWDRLIQAVAVVSHGIGTKGGE